MKKSGIRGFVLGFTLCAMLFGLAGTVLAAGSAQTLKDVLVGGIRIVIDGQELHPTDAGGNPVNPMIYNGTTYLPVRTVASALGKAVYWDGPTYTVYLGNMDGKLEYPTVMMKDMTSIADATKATNKLTDNYGNTYGYAINGCNYYDGSRFEYLLGTKYSHFKGTLYIPAGMTENYSVVMTVTADGKQLYSSPAMDKTSAPVPFDVNVTGYNDVIIEFTSTYGIEFLNIGDAGFYQ